jgi:carboxyl-terminal processing protease
MRRLLGWLAVLGPITACGLTGSTGGIHAEMAYSEAGGLRVVEIPSDGPAAAAGLHVGDRIASIDGERVGNLSLQEIVERLRGPVGTHVEIEVIREGEWHVFEIAREPYIAR